ncbi:MAG: ABC transporter substrate-binding protein [Flavobacteriales bacterium]|nr:ABC transporter substrate-binding protein [Flavobacteriales bacterium]
MTVIDQMNREVTIPEKVNRIVSLVPSQSEFLWEMGLSDKLVGISKFCIHPDEMYRNTMRVGGTKQINIETIKELNPDLIIGNKEENVKEQIEELEKIFQVWMSDINNLDDAFAMMNSLSEILNFESDKKNQLIKIEEDLNSVKGIFNGLKVVYLIWHDPVMAVGNGTFINSVLEYVGLENALKNESRYPELTNKKLEKLDIDVCMLSSEPFPFNDSHLKYYSESFSNFSPRLVDGEMFSWYGTRLAHLPSYVKQLKKVWND